MSVFIFITKTFLKNKTFFLLSAIIWLIISLISYQFSSKTVIVTKKFYPITYLGNSLDSFIDSNKLFLNFYEIIKNYINQNEIDEINQLSNKKIISYQKFAEISNSIKFEKEKENYTTDVIRVSYVVNLVNYKKSDHAKVIDLAKQNLDILINSSSIILSHQAQMYIKEKMRVSNDSFLLNFNSGNYLIKDEKVLNMIRDSSTKSLQSVVSLVDQKIKFQIIHDNYLFTIKGMTIYSFLFLGFILSIIFSYLLLFLKIYLYKELKKIYRLKK
jgi:hypothetical protein